ncbi:MAG: hypothetical protein ACK5VX_16910, partial [Akkermansiaceae bacterium]
MSETTQPTSNATAESEALEQTIAVVHEASAVEASELTSAATATAVEERVPYPVPENIVLNQFRLKPLAELQKIAADLPRKIQGGITKTQLIYEIICFYTMNGTNVTCEGVLEFGKEHFAMIRDPRRSFRPSQDDIHIGGPVLNDAKLRNGQLLKVKVRQPVQRDKYLTTAEILEIEGKPTAEWVEPQDFDKLTPMFPDARIHLEGEGTEYLGVRVIDLIA